MKFLRSFDGFTDETKLMLRVFIHLTKALPTAAGSWMTALPSTASLWLFSNMAAGTGEAPARITLWTASSSPSNYRMKSVQAIFL